MVSQHQLLSVLISISKLSRSATWRADEKSNFLMKKIAAEKPFSSYFLFRLLNVATEGSKHTRVRPPIGQTEGPEGPKRPCREWK
ncbi:hypothetical protein GQ44DRAFT_382359 [Phaeosphaeriaceae sp. PMI808]|nr:hypothetical protein GQ44DRAFT_382359 [Phaeosphaeriaceae sp. PMI808]